MYLFIKLGHFPYLLRLPNFTLTPTPHLLPRSRLPHSSSLLLYSLFTPRCVLSRCASPLRLVRVSPLVTLWIDLKRQVPIQCDNYPFSVVDEALVVSPISYLTSTILDGIPLVGSYTLCDNYPYGFDVHEKDSHVCRLKKDLYELDQAPRAW